MSDHHTFVIAEAGVNHNGSIQLAKELILKAKQIGADAIKFQSFISDKMVSKKAEKAQYQKSKTIEETQYEMLKKLELNKDAQSELLHYCNTTGIQFLSSPFDIESINILNNLGLESFKVPSGEITNYPYLCTLGRLNKKIFLSTGMCDLGEIEDALNLIVRMGTERNKIVVLQCNTEYPTPFEDVNLRAMMTIKKAFNVNVGYSDHTSGIEAAIAAVALGATVIEKHFTLDRNLEGPDHKASLEPKEFQDMVKAIRNIEKALGTGIKKISNSELKNRKVARKSIVALQPIQKGDIFTEHNLGVKRPGYGLSPMLWDLVLGKKSTRDFQIDDVIEL